MAADGPTMLDSMTIAEKLLLIQNIIWHLTDNPDALKAEGLLRQAGSHSHGISIVQALSRQECPFGYQSHDFWNGLQRVVESMRIEIPIEYAETLRSYLLKEEDPNKLGELIYDLLIQIADHASVGIIEQDHFYAIELMVLLVQLATQVSRYAKFNQMHAGNTALVISANFLNFFDLIDMQTPSLSPQRSYESMLDAARLQQRLQGALEVMITTQIFDTPFRQWAAEHLPSSDLVKAEYEIWQASHTAHWQRKQKFFDTTLAQTQTEISRLSAKTSCCLKYYQNYQSNRPSEQDYAKMPDEVRIGKQAEFSKLQMGIYQQLHQAQQNLLALQKTREKLETERRGCGL